MGLNSKYVYNAQATGTLNLDTLVAGTITGGPTMLMSKLDPKHGLSALVTVEAETDTLTIGLVWQVSNDASTWVTCAPVNNAATVVLATGTGGGDPVVTRVIPANDAVYGWRYARAAIQNLVATGAATDTYAIAYNYVRP